jgi:hypothetical protein
MVLKVQLSLVSEYGQGQGRKWRRVGEPGRDESSNTIFFPSLKKKTNSVAWVRERTIPTERPVITTAYLMINILGYEHKTSTDA